MADKKEEGEGVWRFPKLKGADNIIQWERNMITAMESAYLYGWIDGTKVLPVDVSLDTMKAEGWTRTNIREYQREIEDYNLKNIALRDRIKRMCNEHVVQSIDTEGKSVKEVWNVILTRYKSQKWSKKWAVMNRFEELSYTDEKSIGALASKIIVIKSEWKDLKITEDELFVLKLLNILGPSFETYLTILNEEARRDENLLNLNTLITRLEQEEHRMQTQEKQINALHRHIEGRNLREGREGRDRSKGDRNVEDERDDNNSSDDESDGFCPRCYTNHRLPAYKYCLDKDVICSNDKCKKKSHQFKNCRQEDGGIHKKESSKEDKFDKSDKTSKTPMRHIASVKIFINGLMTSHCDSYILDSEATHHCSNNKALFKNLRATHEVAKTASGEVLNIEAINNIKIPLPNGEFLILSEAMYIPTLVVNLIVTSRLWHKGFDVLYPTDHSCKICLPSGQLVANADMVNNQWVLRTTDSKAINAVTSTPAPATPVEEAYIFAFAKPTTDVKVWHRRLVHASYRNVLANAKKVIDMENVTDPIPETVCEPCMAGRSQQERSRVPMTKTTEFI